MAIPLQHRRGTKAQNDAFTGLIGEVTVDTENKNLRLHDGSTAGGKKIENSTEISARMSGFKNGIINPAFEINQYANIDTAPVAMVNSTYQIDRTVSVVSGVTGTIQRLAKSLKNGKYVHSLKCVATSTASGTLGQNQRVELFYNGEAKAFGAWIKSNNINARLLLDDGITTTSSTAHTGGGAYEFLSFPKTIASGATRLYAYAVIASSTLTAVSITAGNYIESTMWQLEDGSVPTKFEQRPVGLELSLCQRYYFKDATNHYLNSFYKGTTGDYYTTYYLPVAMRAIPSTSVILGTDINGVNSARTTTNFTNKYSVNIAFTSTTSAHGYYSLNQLIASAEL